MKTCQCCGYKTLESDIFDICPICFWHDDPACNLDPDYRGGINGNISLREAQENYRLYGACDKASVNIVRKANEHDIRDTLWTPLESEVMV